MARTINWIERISEGFERCDSMSQADITCELFSRLSDPAKQEALRRITNHARMEGLTPRKRKEEAEVPADPAKQEDAKAAGVQP